MSMGRLSLAGLYLALCTLVWFLMAKNPRMWIQPYTDPVILTTLRDIETNISSRPLPGGPETRYVHFANQIKNAGFNNVLNEVLLLAHLAHASGRVYVVRPMLLQDRPTLPLHAFVAGPVSGGGQNVSASLQQWNVACPLHERTYVSSTQVRAMLGLDETSDALEHMERWTSFLRRSPERCIEITRGSLLVFDFDVVVSPKIVSLWTAFSMSPIVTQFAWSPLVHRGLARTLPLFGVSPKSESESLVASASGANVTTTSTYTIDGLVAIHLRRGDFKQHCAFLAESLPIYTSWNLLPMLPDRYTAPSPQNLSDFTRRCYPTPQQIAGRLHTLRAESGNRLHRVYIATNAPNELLDELKRILRDDAWSDVVTSRDLVLPPDERIVDQGVDMEIASRADVFVGNGFSSLTATITMLRLTRGKNPSTVRFW